MINSWAIHGNSCLYKTYNYRELITNYHQIIFSVTSLSIFSELKPYLSHPASPQCWHSLLQLPSYLILCVEKVVGID